MDVLITVTESHDWKALYIDGKLYLDGHDLDYRDILAALAIKFTHAEVSDEWVEENGGRFPKTSAGIPLDNITNE